MDKKEADQWLAQTSKDGAHHHYDLVDRADWTRSEERRWTRRKQINGWHRPARMGHTTTTTWWTGRTGQGQRKGDGQEGSRSMVGTDQQGWGTPPLRLGGQGGLDKVRGKAMDKKEADQWLAQTSKDGAHHHYD